jgi:hypothetical protein
MLVPSLRVDFEGIWGLYRLRGLKRVRILTGGLIKLQMGLFPRATVLMGYNLERRARLTAQRIVR